MSTQKKPYKRALSLALLTVGSGVLLDQVSKDVALRLLTDGPLGFDALGLQLARNDGFLGGGANWAFRSSARAHVLGLGLSFSLTACLVAWELRESARMIHFGLLLLAAGVLGNLTDRLVRWSVVDFIRVQAPWSERAIIMNVADSLQWIGVVCLMAGAVKVAVRIARGSERRIASSRGFSNGRKAWRLTVVGSLVFLLGPEIAGTVFLMKESPALLGPWVTLLVAFDLPIFYLIYRMAERVANLANGPLFATLRYLERIGTSDEPAEMTFRDGEDTPELAIAMAKVLKKSKAASIASP